MKHRINVLSLVTGILMILGGGFGLVIGIIAVAGSLSGLPLFSAIISLISSVGVLAAGIIYTLNARKKKRRFVRQLACRRCFSEFSALLLRYGLQASI